MGKKAVAIDPLECKHLFIYEPAADESAVSL